MPSDGRRLPFAVGGLGVVGGGGSSRPLTELNESPPGETAPVEVEAEAAPAEEAAAGTNGDDPAAAATIVAETTGEKSSLNGEEQKTTTTVVLADAASFLKPLPDSRSYRAIRLPNSLVALLVSDPTTDIEAGSVHLRAGHFQDPAHRPGLAHFHEHMLFLGTEKYPNEEEYEAFLSRNGGSSNAYTDMEDTNYYFNVAPLDHDDDDDDDEDSEGGPAAGTGTSAALSGALDRLSQFFISPLFSEDSVERELRAVDSEYKNSLASDTWRNYQLLKSGTSEGHPFRKFGCGNYNTLTNGGDISGEIAESSGGSNPRDDLVKFWEDNYKPTNMRLCIVGRAGLDDLQKTVEETFGAIAPPPPSVDDEAEEATNGDSSGKLFRTEHSTYGGVRAFDASNLGLVREVVPVVEQRIIKMQFATPPLEDPVLQETRPYRVLSHLIGHESPGSLHSLLNDEGLINSLSSGVGIDTSDFSLCSLTVSLTKKGMEQRERVLELIWQWIALIRSAVEEDEDGLMARYHDEMRQMSKVNFSYRENGDPTDFSSSVADLLFYHEPSRVLAASSMTGPFDAEVTKAFLERLRPQNCIVTVWDPDLEKEEGSDVVTSASGTSSASASPWQEEKWYGAKYREVRLPEEVVDHWDNPKNLDSRLKLPKLNEFIPTDFSLRCDDDDAAHAELDEPKGADANEAPGKVTPPSILIERPGLRMWHKMDRTFRVPKTSLTMHLTTPNIYRSPRAMTLNRLYQKVLRDDLNEFVYDAGVAGCSYRVACLPTGYRISVSGYSEKLPHLLDVVTSRMLSLIAEMKEGPEAHPGLALKFEKARQNLLRQTKNFRLDTPYETSSYISRMLVEDNVWHVDNYISEMEGEYADSHPLTLEGCAQVAEECLRGRGKVEALCMGNINEKEAKEVASVIEQHFLQSRPLAEEEYPQFRSHKLPTQAEAVRLFGPDVESSSIPTKIEDVAHSESEANNAIQVILQTASEHELGYEGTGTLELLSYIAYNSAYNRLRTQEQLGYIVSAFTKKTAGSANAFAVVIQSSSTLPGVLEERIEAWLESFREELVNMPEERVAMEAAAVVAQLLERDMKLSDEVSSAWGEIVSTETLSAKKNLPAFDRLERLADTLTIGKECTSETVTAKGLKQNMIDFFDKYLLSTSPERRALSARVYCQKSKEEYEKNVGKPGVLSSYADSRYLKQFLSISAPAPYWI
uniref:Insulin-degrading enzyme n=1 Tax=Odontella aurita TaxID=265563 RepID=A0A7S4HIU6_9STRA